LALGCVFHLVIGHEDEPAGDLACSPPPPCSMQSWLRRRVGASELSRSSSP